MLKLWSSWRSLLRRKDREKAAWFQQQHKESKMRFYGVRIPQVRRIVAKYSKRFQQLSLQEKFSLAKMFYESHIFEQATVGDSLLELGCENMSPDAFNLLDEVVDSFTN